MTDEPTAPHWHLFEQMAQTEPAVELIIEGEQTATVAAHDEEFVIESVKTASGGRTERFLSINYVVDAAESEWVCVGIRQTPAIARNLLLGAIVSLPKAEPHVLLERDPDERLTPENATVTQLPSKTLTELAQEVATDKILDNPEREGRVHTQSLDEWKQFCEQFKQAREVRHD